MYIGELERRTGISRAKIYAWLKAGLLPPVAKPGTWADFPDGYEDLILTVEALYRAGRETEEIRRTMRFLRREAINSAEGDRRHDIVLAMDVLDNEIAAITECKRALNQVLKRSFRPDETALTRSDMTRPQLRPATRPMAGSAIARSARAFWSWALGREREPGVITPIAR